MTPTVQCKMRYAIRIALLALTFSFFAIKGSAHAQSFFPTPEGFKAERVRRAFKGTGTEFNWLKVSDSTLALYLYEGSQNSGFTRSVQKRYDQNLYKYSARAKEWSRTLVQFNTWLLAAGVDFLDHSLKQSPVQMVIDPMVDLTETNARFDFEKLEPETHTDWWVAVWMEPTQDVDFLFAYAPVMIHEFGHFLFHSYLNRESMIPKGYGFVNFTLGPIDEAFADAVSYLFTGEALVGRRYDYAEQKMIDFRHALSSSTADRERIRNGTWAYKIAGGDDHVQGQPYRDVLIEIASGYGIKAMFEVNLQIQRKLTQAGSAIVSLSSNRAEVNQAYNEGVPAVLAAYPRLITTLR